MARHKRKNKGAVASSPVIVENGVEVSRWGTDQGYMGLPAGAVDARDGLVLKEMQLAVHDRRSTNAYRMDHLDRLESEGAIDRRVADCGRYFRNDVALALSSGFPQRTLEVISGGGAGKDVIKNWKAYRKVKGAIRAMGGNGSVHTRAVFDYIVEEKTLCDVVGNSARPRSRQRLYLLEALYLIADYYYPLKKRR